MNVLDPVCLRREQLRGSNFNAGKWIELDQGPTIDGALKIATQLAKGNIILGDKVNFQKICYTFR